MINSRETIHGQVLYGNARTTEGGTSNHSKELSKPKSAGRALQYQPEDHQGNKYRPSPDPTEPSLNQRLGGADELDTQGGNCPTLLQSQSAGDI
jgi:hypothetical protein